ncbi:uncharacterized protein Z518_08675 [Rhinocladiella mackenziei CBS 650.93]|uniref:Rhinocladiella mackenziei CBS 650.93 unplaced genomic scaffold supercont1.6, whole genome shotgun sequence n=1 Tax=Rhinocladiella mackenziei CBS 650.93 TaxID=1442369 RepID=A0A0D2GWY0_9EURO|nr:uncharacterized protein Z518_08675 [Rhinocladiella mackenziei CBS 650.93]KIX02733.1 hypothetical protein Z518_08675 [Rhinocladiella mackenziei CBS 650.93]
MHSASAERGHLDERKQNARARNLSVLSAAASIKDAHMRRVLMHLTAGFRMNLVLACPRKEMALETVCAGWRHESIRSCKLSSVCSAPRIESRAEIAVRWSETGPPRPQFDEDNSPRTEGSTFDAFRRPIPPSDVLQSLANVYIERIADQPLPLFDVKTLPFRVTRFSPGLLRSFLALTVRFSNHDFFKDVKSTAVDFYKASSRTALFTQIAEPTGSLDVLQSFCLLCLGEIADGKMVRAWMALGIAARMAICTNLSISETGKSKTRNSDMSRCIWSLFILDRIHGSSFRTVPAITDEDILPEMPQCAAQPRKLPLTEIEDLRILEEKDDGINSYSLQLLSTWGRLMSYLKTIRQGNLEDAWRANSTYQQIKSQMSQFETVFPEAHRFRNARFHERTFSDLAQDRAYWAPWVFTQCIYHTIHCTLNHPFLHVVRIHGRQRLRSPSFLQHAIDQTVLHSAWVVRIVELCEERNFVVFDPFVGHLAAMIATAQFFLQFSKDTSLAARASRDFERLHRFVENMANEHTHLAHTVTKLSKLAQFAAPCIEATQIIQPPKVETSLLWDLLDYAVSSSPMVSSGGTSEDIELNVNTQFLSPVNQDTPRPTEAVALPPCGTAEGPAENFWEDTSFQFDMADFSNLPDMSTWSMQREVWFSGHL